MRYLRNRAIAATWMASLASLTGCVSSFEFELPEDHPARPTATPAGPLPIPNPFDVAPPQEPAGGGADTMHEVHAEESERSSESKRKREMQGTKKEDR